MPHLADAPLVYWCAFTARRAPHAPARVGRLRLCLPRFGAAEVAATCPDQGVDRLQQMSGGGGTT